MKEWGSTLRSHASWAVVGGWMLGMVVELALGMGSCEFADSQWWNPAAVFVLWEVRGKIWMQLSAPRAAKSAQAGLLTMAGVVGAMVGTVLGPGKVRAVFSMIADIAPSFEQEARRR